MLFELTPLDIGKADRCLIDLSVELDFTMELMIRLDGKPDAELVSLIHGPQEELGRAVDEYLAQHRYELTHHLKKCPRCDYSVFKDEAPASCPEGCGPLVDVKNLDVSEDHLRQEAEFQLTGLGLLTRGHANLCRRIVTENLDLPFSGNEDVARPLDETLKILSARMQDNIVTLAAIATKANDPTFLGGRTDLLPHGATLNEKHADYLHIRGKLEALGAWLRGLEYNHPEFVDFPPEYPLTPYRFPPPVALPVVSRAQTKEPVVDQAETSDATPPNRATESTESKATATEPPCDVDAEDQQDSKDAAGRNAPTPGAGKSDLMNADGKEITKHATAIQIANHFDWPVGRVRTELSREYWGPLGKGGKGGRPDKPFWTANKFPLGRGANTQFLWVTKLVVPYLKSVFEQQP